MFKFKNSYIIVMPISYLDRSLKLIDLLLGPEEDIHYYFKYKYTCIDRNEILTMFSREELIDMMDPDSERRKQVIDNYTAMAENRIIKYKY